MDMTRSRHVAASVAEGLQLLAGIATCAAVAAMQLVGCRSHVPPPSDGATGAMPVSIVSAHYFSTGDGDCDETYEVVLRNDGDSPVSLTSALLDGRELKSPDLAAAAALKSFSFDIGGRSAAQRRVRNPSDPDVRWWQFYPSPTIPPRGHAAFMANFRGRAKSHALEVRMADGTAVSHHVPRHVLGGRAITYLGFSGDGRTALVRHSAGVPPCGVSVNGKAIAGARMLPPANAGLPGAVVMPLTPPVKKGDPVFVELSFPDGSRTSAFIRAMPGVYSTAPHGNRDDELLPEEVRRRFGFDDTLAVHRLPHDVACDDSRMREPGASASACLAARKSHLVARPLELSGVDFCTALYPGVWNIYAPMADAVFSKPYRLHWASAPARFMEEESAMVADAVRHAAPRPVIWVPDRFGRETELEGREFTMQAWCALLCGVRVVRCHHWKNDVRKPFDGNPGLEEAWMRFNADFRRMRPLVERLIPANGWTDRNSRIAVLEGWCADEGALLLVRNLDYSTGVVSLRKPRLHPFRSSRRDSVSLSYPLPKWLVPDQAVDALDGSRIEAAKDGARLTLRLASIGDFRIVWIPSVDGGAAGSSLSAKETMQ